MSITDNREASTAWVCGDCNDAHHGTAEEPWTGETQHPHPDAAFYVEPYTPPEPLNLIGEDDVVTAGLLWEEHAEDCEARQLVEAGFPNEVECACARREFSKSWCHGCGTHLAGSREALTIWHMKENAA